MTWFGRVAFRRIAFRRVARLLPLIPMFLLAASCSDFFVSTNSTASVAVSPKALILKAAIPATATTTAIPGDTSQLSATATSVAGTTTDETTGATWTSSNSAAVTVSSAGLVSAVGSAADATSIVTAKFGGQTATSNVLTYVGVAPTTIAINIPSGIVPGAMTPNLTFRLTATAALSNNPTHDVSTYVTWTSNNTSTATIDANGNVTVLSTASAGGNFTITATATFGSGTATGTSATFSLPTF